MDEKKRVNVGTSCMLAPILLVSYALKLCGLEALQFLGNSLGGFFFLINFRKKIVDANLAMTLGNEYSPADMLDLKKRIYQNTGLVFLEIIRNFSLSRKELCRELVVSDPDAKKIREILARGKGAVFISAHLANWELSAMGMAAQGYPVTIVVKKMNNPIAQALIERVRHRTGLGVIYSGGTLEKMKIALREGKAIGFMVDQNTTGTKAIRVNFFKVPASSIRGLATLVRETGVPVVPYCAERIVNGHNQVRIMGELPYITAPELPEASVERISKEEFLNTQSYQDAIEKLVRRNPQSWLWIHRRWKADRTPIVPEAEFLRNVRHNVV